MIVLLALGLGVDAFAVSVCSAMSVPAFRRRDALWLSLYFGGFQAGMALLGSFVGEHLGTHIGALGRFAAFILLAVIGGNMVWAALRKKEKEQCPVALRHRRMAVLAVAVSVDALAAGISLPFFSVSIPLAILLIGVTAALLSLLGSFFGERLGSKFRERAELVGGLTLIALGIWSLF